MINVNIDSNYDSVTISEKKDLGCSSYYNMSDFDISQLNQSISSIFPIVEVEVINGKVHAKIGVPHLGCVLQCDTKNQVINGNAIIYSPNETVLAEITYCKGEMSGPCTLYYDNGRKMFEGSLKRGYREGMGTEYNEDGSVAFHGIFKGGKKKTFQEKVGKFSVVYASNGDPLVAYQTNREGEKDGWCYSYKQGKVTRGDIYREGKLIRKGKEFTGTTMTEYNMKNKCIYQGKFVNSLKQNYPRKKCGLCNWSSKTTFYIIVTISCIFLAVLIAGLCYLNEYRNCNGYKTNSQLVINAKSCNYVPHFKPSPKSEITNIYIKGKCFKRANTFRVDGLKKLQTITIGKESFSRVDGTDDRSITKEVDRHFHILNCPELDSISIGQYSFVEWAGEFELKNLPVLRYLTFSSYASSESNSFYYNSLNLNCIYCFYLLRFQIFLV